MLHGSRKPHNYAVFLSGSGSTLQALLEMQHQFNIKLVVSNKKSTGLKRANRFGIPCLLLTKEMNFDSLNDVLNKHKISQIFLAGFMKILPETFVKQWENKIFNIHPSLLPAYKGLHASEKSWEDNFDMGATIHMVTKEMDEGEVILQKTSLKQPKLKSRYDAEILLRKTEQQLLRECAYRNSL